MCTISLKVFKDIYYHCNRNQFSNYIGKFLKNGQKGFFIGQVANKI